MTYTVKIVETNIGFLDFETEEEALAIADAIYKLFKKD